MQKITTRKFIWGTDQKDSVGWIPKGMPNFDAGAGRQIAHDSIEHFSMKEGIEQEMLAFGAILFIRGLGGYLNLTGSYLSKNRNYGWHLSFDFANFLAESGKDISVPRNTSELDDEYAEEMIDNMVAQAWNNIDDELEACGVEMDVAEVFQRAIGWVRCGFRAAQKRFSDSHPEEVCYMFHQIENEVDDKYMHGEEGDELIVKFSTETLRYEITRKHANPWNEYA